MSILKASRHQTFAPRLPHSHHAEHPNYPSERYRVVVAVAVPEGRCVTCKGAPQPCALCRHDWDQKRCRCLSGDSMAPHTVDCPRYEEKPHGH